jgi:hypothetical protein
MDSRWCLRLVELRNKNLKYLILKRIGGKLYGKIRPFKLNWNGWKFGSWINFWIKLRVKRIRCGNVEIRKINTKLRIWARKKTRERKIKV